MRAVVAVLLFVTAAHAGLWGLFQEKQPAPDFRGILPSLSYTPFEPDHITVDGDAEKIRADMKSLATLTRAIRLYGSTEGNELVPPIAAEFGLKVTVGAWIGKDKDRNKREIEAVIDLARRNSNVVGVVVGNETIYRGDAVPLENLGRFPNLGATPRKACGSSGSIPRKARESSTTRTSGFGKLKRSPTTSAPRPWTGRLRKTTSIVWAA